MPIKPEHRHRYPPHWPALRERHLALAGHRCEGSPAYPDCRAVNGQPHPVTGSKVVLTLAHWPDPTPENGADENLQVWCQRCHNAMNHAHRHANARRTRQRRKALGDLFEGPYAQD